MCVQVCLFRQVESLICCVYVLYTNIYIDFHLFFPSVYLLYIIYSFHNHNTAPFLVDSQ